MPPTPLTATYKEINGTKITTDIYLPPSFSNSDNAPHHKYPVLINIHGGAFMLGHSSLISLPQVSDCLARDWIVVAPNHRLCPQVNILDGPVQDCRDLLSWVYTGGLDAYLREQGQGQGHSQYECVVDENKVMAFGTSSGGFLALALGYDTPRPPRAILNFYGAIHFTHPFWSQPLPHVQEKLPPLDPAFIRQVYDETPVPIGSGISLEGQGQSQGEGAGGREGEGKQAGPDFTRPRDAFALTQIANGTVLAACYPNRDVREIDPIWRVGEGFPPTCIVHGTADRMVPGFLSRELLGVLRAKGVECEMVDVEGEDHTFAMGMQVGSRTWEVQRKGFEFLERVIGRED
ncbi:alpha/beta-hydrolase [Aspergillus steynii IBT 23096]|uniref:Alpha/beta-hydrolase n=1 Tax=Aspergillus steynii IBT 23096 TaxID=1392250 RepID=A0A2I2G9S3_9EURO|nr:alpha/beta-hydrolase [Aspergillus steynii IBT 23096]PLB49618.1 alpha/beta-hydrolase [Aspergillus steynii IBT 23096]